MIEIVISDKATTNSSYIYKSIEERLNNNKKSILIVPEQYTLETDIEFISSISYKSVMDAKVLSFSSFSNFLMDRLSKRDLKFLNKEGKIMLLSNIMTELNEDLSLFKNSHKNIDFINTLVKLISAFKENKLGDDFFKALDTDETEEATRLKFNEIKLIIDSYEKATEDKFIDSEDVLSIVSELIEGASFLKDYHFYFDKFDSMEESKLEVIEALDKSGIEITISLNMPSEGVNDIVARREIFDLTYNFYRKLNELFEIKINSLESNKRFKDLDHLLRNFESYELKRYQQKATNILFIESISTKSEIENIAIIINKLIKVKNLRYRDFAIYLTNGKEYENELIKTFNRYNLPIFLDKSRKMSDNHIVKTFLALIRLIVNNFRKEDLLFIINSKIIEVKNAEAETFINFLQYRKIYGSMFLDDKYFYLDLDFYQKNLENDPRKDERIDKKKAEYEIVNNLRAKILNLIKNIDFREGSVKEYASGIYDMISDKMIIDSIKDFQSSLKANGELDYYRENEQIWDQFMEILDQLVLIMGDSLTNLARVYQLIESVSEDITIGLIPPSKDHIQITDFKRERVSNKPINIILGLNDAYFPSIENKDFLISEDEKEKLKQRGFDLKLYDKDTDLRERLSFYKLIAISKKLILSFALSDREGKELKKALVLKDILYIFNQEKINSMTNLRAEDAIFSKESLKKYSLEKIQAFKKDQDIGLNDKKIANAFISYLRSNMDNKENEKIYHNLIKGLYFTNDKKVLEKSISTRLFSKNAFSVSEIETYSRCPYKYFVSYGLRPDREDDFDIDQMEIGNIVHKSLEELSRIIKEEENLTDEKLDFLLEENFRKGIDLNLDSIRKDSPKNVYILNNMLTTAKRNARVIRDQLDKGEFVLDSFEQDFDKGGYFDPVYVDNQNYLRGRIDRIDRAGDLVRVIDYKTGAKTFRLVNVLNGLDLQLLVYMIAVKRSKNKLFPVGSFYLPLKDEIEKIDKISYSDKKNMDEIISSKFMMTGLLVKINDEVLRLIDKDYDKSDISIIDLDSKNILSLSDFEKLSDFAKHLIANIIKRIKEGNIELKPIMESTNKKECYLCEFRGICKFDEIIDSHRFRQIDKKKTIDSLENDDYDRD